MNISLPLYFRSLRSILLFACTFIFLQSYSQCQISHTENTCEGIEITFKCNSINASQVQWKFDDDSTSFSTCDLTRKFWSAGKKHIILNVLLTGGGSCTDTLLLDIKTVKAHFNLDQNRPQCNTIITLRDSTNWGGTGPGDSITRRTIDWGYPGKNRFQSLIPPYPKDVKHIYTRNGYFYLTYSVGTNYGCVDTLSKLLYMPGPIPWFDTFIRRNYCTGEKVELSNLSSYRRRDSSIWIWSFGDNTYGNQYDTITGASDTMNHRYSNPGQYNIFLYQSWEIKIGTTKKRCTVVVPDTSNGQQHFFKVNIFKCDSLGINQYNVSGDIRFSPNPSNGEVIFQSNEKILISIIDALGRTVMEFMNEGRQTISLDELNPGLYHVLADGRKFAGRLIVQ